MLSEKQKNDIRKTLHDIADKQADIMISAYQKVFDQMPNATEEQINTVFQNMIETNYRLAIESIKEVTKNGGL